MLRERTFASFFSFRYYIRPSVLFFFFRRITKSTGKGHMNIADDTFLFKWAGWMAFLYF